MRAFLQSTSKYLLTRLPIGDTYVRDLTVLHPNMQKVETGACCIRKIAQNFALAIKEDQIPGVDLGERPVHSLVKRDRLQKSALIPD